MFIWLFTNCISTVYQLFTNCLPTVYQLYTNNNQSKILQSVFDFTYQSTEEHINTYVVVFYPNK